MFTSVYDLRPLESQHQRSFYGKAMVLMLADGTRVLRSYRTIVASISPDGAISRHWDGWSATTGRHVKAFCHMNKTDFESIPLTRAPL